MATDLAQIQAIKTQTLAVLVEITASPKPTYTIDGQMVSWGDYLRNLQQTIDWCDQQIAAQEPVEIHTQGFV